MTQEASSDTTETQTSETTATTDAAETTEATSAETATADAAEGDGILGSAADTDAGAGDADSGETKDGEAGDGAEAQADGLPDKYELTAPEGYDIDETVLAEATPIFHELGLGQEQAQKLVPLGQKLVERILQGQADEFAQTRAQWATEVKDDPEIGKANLKETQRLAAKALDHFIGPREVVDADGKPIIGQDGKPVIEPFRQLLIDTGLENHPVMVKAFRKIGMALAEDGTIARSGQGPATPKSREQILYPDDAPKADSA